MILGAVIAAAAVAWIVTGLATVRWVTAPWLAREYPYSWAAGDLRADAMVFGLFLWPPVLMFGLLIFVCARLAAWVIDDGNAA